MNGPIYIYGLFDPRTDLVRYVGKALNVQQRLARHLKNPRCKHCHAWLIKMKMEGIAPGIRILESLSSGADWCAAEKKWIKHFKDIGNDLTNLTEGGEGAATYGRLGKKNTPEHIRKSSRPGVPVKHTAEGNSNRANGVRAYYKRMSEAGLIIKRPPCSQSRKIKIGNANRGRVLPMTEARIAAIVRSRGRPSRNRGSVVSDDIKAKISASKKGKPWSNARKLAQSQRSHAHVE